MWGFWEFIVYGQVPGTSIQISFESWLVTVIGIISVWALVYVRRHQLDRKLYFILFGLYAAFVIRSSISSGLPNYQHLQA